MSTKVVAPSERYPVRVMVMPAWEHVSIQVDDATSVAQLKREAVRAALKTTAHAGEYVVKFRGALVEDESVTLRAIGVVPNAPFIVLPARRQPVR